MFINYFKDSSRDSPLNLAVARVLVGLYLIWKLLSEDWGELGEWPVLLHGEYEFLAPPIVLQWLPVEAVLTALLLCVFILGYRLAPVSFLSALLVAHLGAVRYTITDSGSTDTYFISVMLLVFFGLYSATDSLSLDGIRRSWKLSIDELNDRLQSSDEREHRMVVLKLFLLVVGIYYFGSAFEKFYAGPLPTWVSAESMTRWLLVVQEWFVVEEWLGWREAIASTIADVVYQFPVLGAVMAWGTIFLEAGFLVGILAGVTITPFVLGFFAWHAGIALVLGPFFLDNYVFLSLFFAWDTLYERVAPSSDEAIDLVYDEHCYFCARSLYPFKLLDATDAVRFHSQYTVPEQYRATDEVDFEDAMYVFADGNAYAGYDAFRRLAKQLPVLAPLAWVMGRRPVARVGNRVYRYIAENRTRHFTCAVGTEESTVSSTRE